MSDAKRKRAELRIDNAIRELWLSYRDLLDVLPSDQWNEADMDLWEKIVFHRAVRERLKGGKS